MSFLSTQWARLNEAVEARIHVLPQPMQQALDRISVQTGYSQTQAASAIIVIFGIFMILSSMAQFVCNIIGFAIPAYLSMASIDSPGSDDDTVWLMYWVVFATFSLIDFFADRILRYFPFYWLAKCFFLVWCYYPLPPRQNGAVKIHRKILRPLFVARRQGIDQTLQNTLGMKLQHLSATALTAAMVPDATSAMLPPPPPPPPSAPPAPDTQPPLPDTSNTNIN